MARNFNSNNFAFRPTSLSAGLQAAGLTDKLHMVREPKLSVTSTEEKPFKERMIPVRRQEGEPCRRAA